MLSVKCGTDGHVCVLQPAYVLQIFPPCEFSESHLSQLAPDLLNRISSISPHLMIVITSVWPSPLGPVPWWIFAKNLQDSRKHLFFCPSNEVDGAHPINSLSTFLFLSTIFFFLFCFRYSCLVYLSFSKKKEKTQGWNKPEWVLLDHFLLYFLFIEVLFLCMEMLWRQNQDVWAKHCGPFCFFFFVFCDRHVNWKELSFCDGSRHFTLWFLNSSIQTSSLWLFLSRTCKSWVPVTWQPPPAPPPFLALLPLPPSSSAFNKPQYHLGDFEYGTL